MFSGKIIEETITVNKSMYGSPKALFPPPPQKKALKDISGTRNCIMSWLQGELKVVVVKKQARWSLEALIDNGKSISEEINKSKNSINKADPNCTEMELKVKLADLEGCPQLQTA